MPVTDVDVTFQLHVIDSEEVRASSSSFTIIPIFQLYVIDSLDRQVQTLDAQAVTLSTPCNGFERREEH